MYPGAGNDEKARMLVNELLRMGLMHKQYAVGVITRGDAEAPDHLRIILARLTARGIKDAQATVSKWDLYKHVRDVHTTDRR